MGAYTYVAINETGKREAGELSASDTAAAREVLRQRGLVALELNAEVASAGKAKTRNFFTKKVKPATLQVFSRQLATMIQAGVNVVTALNVLAEQTEDEHFSGIIRTLRVDVEDGALLSQAMGRHPDTFSKMYLSMVEAGEASGALDTVLDRVAYQIEKQNQLRRRVKSAMMYPSVVLVFAIVVLIGMLLFLVPVFEGIFSDLGGELPALTKVTVTASDSIRSWWYIMFPAIGLMVFGVRKYLKTDTGRYRWHKFGLSAPMGVGAIVSKVAVARFARTLATLVSSGVDIIRALEISGQTAGNALVEEATLHVRDQVRAGERLATPMAASAAFPPMVSHMIGVGEETGELDVMLSKIADFYEDEVDASIGTLTSVIEPLMMIGVGIMVGVIILSMYMPMFKLVSLIE